MQESISKVTHYIEQHLDEQLDTLRLAKVAGYSRFHFCRVFKIHTGESLMAYVTKQRIQKASIEIRHANKSVIEVAFNAGFQTPTGFLKAFKRHYGMSPKEYKVRSMSKEAHFTHIY